MPCPFCDLGGRAVLENEFAAVILSDPRKVKGHCLVVPKRHVERPWELTEGELLDIFKLINAVEQKLIPTFGDGCDIRQNYRPFLKQDRTKVDHVHFHVIPRRFDDDIYKRVQYAETDLFEDLPESEAGEMAELLRR
ncbi:MAG: HIT family protein [Patescibacteria group bacterium]